MKINFSFYLLSILVLSLLFNCEKDPIKVAPTVTITTVTNITANSAVCIGEIDSDGGAPILARGICWSLINPLPTINDNKTIDENGTGSFTSSITGLNPGETYYFRAYATNSIGTAYSCQITFNTMVTVPILTTAELSAITFSSASCGGNINLDGGTPVTARGICWSTSENPDIEDNKTTDGVGTGNFTSNLSLLITNTTYYIRAYATNDTGTGYGNEISFKTLESGIGTVTDIDGNVYHTLILGTQIWMVENLKTTKYCNGNPIPYITNDLNQTSGAFCWYNNDIMNKAAYGALYNWYAVGDIRNIAPVGWHVPTDTEWSKLTTYLGGENVASAKIKESGSLHWMSPNIGATNESGFSALPGGYRFNGSFYSLSTLGFYWSSTEFDATKSWHCLLKINESNVNRSVDYKFMGFSVRCVKD